VVALGAIVVLVVEEDVEVEELVGGILVGTGLTVVGVNGLSVVVGATVVETGGAVVVVGAAVVEGTVGTGAGGGMIRLGGEVVVVAA
jgi:hypothetical protein